MREGAIVAVKRWKELTPSTRTLVIIIAAIDGSLRIAALVDLARRPAVEIRGSKGRWAVALTVLNSAGVVPTAYFALGRRPKVPVGAT